MKAGEFSFFNFGLYVLPYLVLRLNFAFFVFGFYGVMVWLVGFLFSWALGCLAHTNLVVLWFLLMAQPCTHTNWSVPEQPTPNQ
jgi:hypothetical protein